MCEKLISLRYRPPFEAAFFFQISYDTALSFQEGSADKNLRAVISVLHMAHANLRIGRIQNIARCPLEFIHASTTACGVE